MIRAEAKLRNAYDSSARLSLLARLVAGLGDDVQKALDVERAGVALFITALAARSNQCATLLYFYEQQVARLALALRGCGLDAAEENTQIIRLHPQNIPQGVFDAITPADAKKWLAEAGTMGIV